MLKTWLWWPCPAAFNAAANFELRRGTMLCASLLVHFQWASECSAVPHHVVVMALAVITMAMVGLAAAWVYLFRLIQVHVWSMQQSEETKVEPIEIYSSPELTRTSSTPHPETPWPTPVRRRAVRRGGSRRFAWHRRLSTCIMDPSMPNHCAYQCVLKAAGITPTKKAVSNLRSMTADKIYEAYINYDRIAGLDVRGTVQASDLTLEAYLASIRHSQWASAVEAAAAAQVFQVAMAIKTDDVQVIIGSQVKHCMKLRKCHWRLYRSRIKTTSCLLGVIYHQRRYAIFSASITEV